MGPDRPIDIRSSRDTLPPPATKGDRKSSGGGASGTTACSKHVVGLIDRMIGTGSTRSFATKPVLSREDLISSALSVGTVRGESELGIGLRNCQAFVSSRRVRWIQRRRGSLLSHWMIRAAAKAV